MHFSQRIAVIVLTCGLSAGLVGCGFHLKGTNPSIAPVAYSKMRSGFTEAMRMNIRRKTLAFI